jgi:hypothetical protein
MDSRYFHGYIDGVLRGEIRGWVVDPKAHSRAVTVCIKVNNRLLARVCACHYRPDVAAMFGTHGRHGIMFRLPEKLRKIHGLMIEVISDNGFPIGNRSNRYDNGQYQEDSRHNPTDRRGPMKVLMHLPKTGGTAFGTLLRRSLSQTERLLIYPDAPGIPPEWIYLLTEAQWNQYKCVYGHFFFGIHENIPVECRYATVLRHPVKRVISHYFHYQRRRLSQPGHVPSWKTEEEYAPFELRGRPPSEEFDNLMVRMISGQHPGVGEVTQKHLYRAIRNLDRYFDFVGVMEEPQTWGELQAHMCISGEMKRENVGDYDPGPFESDEWTAHLTRMNAYDLELYRYAQQLAAERRSRPLNRIAS